MADETMPNGGPNYTTRDLLARIEGKLDVVASKQQYAEVELALLKARVDEVEKDVTDTERHSYDWREEVRKRMDHIDMQAEDVRARQKATAYIVAAIVTLSTVITPVVLHFIGAH